MTEDKEAFLDMDSSFSSKVKLGNGENVEVKGKGSIGVEAKPFKILFMCQSRKKISEHWITFEA